MPLADPSEAEVYLGKIVPYGSCPGHDNCEHIGSRCVQTCSRGVDTEGQECHSILV